MSDLKQLYTAIVSSDQKSAIALTQEALGQGVPPLEIVTQCMVPAMDEVGQLFQCEEYFVPELLFSGRAMKGSLELLRPLLAAAGAEPAGRVVAVSGIHRTQP